MFNPLNATCETKTTINDEELQNRMTIHPFDFRLILQYCRSLPYWASYGLTLLAVSGTLLAASSIPQIGQWPTILLLFFTISQSAYWLGLQQGMAALTLSISAINLLFLYPLWNSAPGDAIMLNTGFCILAVLVILTIDMQQRLNWMLCQQQQDFNHAQAVGQIGSWRLELLRDRLNWSDESYRIFCIAKNEELSRKIVLASVHPDDRDYVNTTWDACLSGKSYDIEYRLMLPDRQKWVREKGVTEFGKNGKLSGSFGTIQDITDRKTNELSLAESRLLYAGIVESAMDAIISINAGQQIMLFNTAAENMFRCSAEQVVNTSMQRFIPKRFRTLHGGQLWNFELLDRKTGSTGKSGAVIGLRSNGEEFPIEVSIAQTVLHEQKLFTVIMRDVSERERVDTALHERLKLQDRLAKVAATVPGVICSFRLRPDGSACMPYASPRFEAVYGCSQTEVAEDFSPVFSRIHADDIAHVQQSIAESARSMQPWRDSFRYQHPVKGEIWLEGHSMPQQERDGSVLWQGYIQDISIRKQMEQALQERIARYELVLEGAQDGIWDWDVVKKRMHFSTRWKVSRGFAEDEIGEDETAWSVNIHPEDSPSVLAAVKSHFAGETAIFCKEYRVHCKNGVWKWVLARGIAQRNDAGQVIRMAGSETDITERKLAESRLLERENELRLIMDATPALISYVDLDYRYLRVNKTYETWFGIHKHQIIGKQAREVIGEQAWQIIAPFLERARSGEYVYFDQQIPYGSGKPRWVQASYIPDKDERGYTKGIVVHVIDIDDLKHTELLLRNSEQENALLANLIRVSSQAMGIGYTDGRMGLVNTAFEELTGYSAEELQRIDWATVLTPPEWLEFERKQLAELERSGIPVRYEKEYLRKNGSRVPVELLVHLMTDADGHIQFYYAFINDITERKRAAEAVKASEAFVRDVLNSLPEHVAVLDDSGLVIAVNEPWERFALDNGGSSVNLSTGVNYLDVCRRSAAAGDADALKAADGIGSLVSGKRQEFIMEYACATAERQLWFLMYAKSVSQGFHGIIITHVDITEHKQAEAALWESEARLALIVEQVHAGYWDWDLHTRSLFLSTEWKWQIGFEDHELPSCWEAWESRLHPDDRDSVLFATENYIADRQADYELQYRLRHKDGSYRWIHARGGLLRDQKKQPYRMLGINLDITEYIKSRELDERHDKMEQSFRISLAGQTVAAIAHELNQPLTAIASYADVALKLLQTGNPNPEKLIYVLESCTQQAQRAGQVIKQLLNQVHKTADNPEPVDINMSVIEACDFVMRDQEFSQFKIALNLAGGLSPVLSHPLQLQKVLVNLVRNGLESMLEKGGQAETIRVSTELVVGDPEMVQVAICDSGKGVKDLEELKTFFQPFYTTKPAGLGMGLVISRALIQSYGGNMWAERNTENGLSIYFTLPLQK